MTLLPFVFTALSSALALPMPPPSPLDTAHNTMEHCEAVMARNGINMTTFRTGAVHGIHSLYLEEIRHFFEPLAPANNGIPVVNADLTAKEMILLDSPLAGYDNDFNTMALKVMAFFMLNDVSNFYMQGTNALEKISHQYHMHEIYAAAAPIYRSLKDNPPSDPLLCSCSNDIASNGIFDELVGAAHNLRNFAAKPSGKEYRPQSEIKPNQAEPKLFVYNYDLKTEENQIDSELSFSKSNLETEPVQTDPKLFVYHYDLKTEKNQIDSEHSFNNNNLETEPVKTDPKLFIYNYDLKTEENQVHSEHSLNKNNLETEPGKTDPKLFVYNYDLKTEDNQMDSELSISKNNLETEPVKNDPKLFVYNYDLKTKENQIDSEHTFRKNNLETELAKTNPKLFVYNYDLKTEENQMDSEHTFSKNNLEIKPAKTDPKLFVYNYDLKTEENQMNSKLSFNKNNVETEPGKTDPKLFVYNYDLNTEENQAHSELSVSKNNLEPEPKLFVYNYDLKTEESQTDLKLSDYHYNFEPEPNQIGSQNRFPSKDNEKGIIRSKQVEEYKMEYLRQSNKETANKVLQVDPWQPNTLLGPAEWISYEAMLTSSMLGEEEIKDFATFIYCKLNSH